MKLICGAEAQRFRYNPLNSMSISIGQQLGPYEVTALLGKGGMGEVYRARDTKLKREVAIKFLPEEFLRDDDRTIRFQREAEVLAALNHPNIGAIYDLEDVNGSRFLVLELVEGETLAERIVRAPIPFEEALEITKQICDALEAAHERGIIHRDLKPANVKITPDGKVKVLDFGLAKPIENAPANTTLSNSPTLLSATIGGMILGTAGYMSPEQAKGRAADQRSDIFALGCVLYEMVTGRQAFHGDDVSEVLAAVLKTEPDFNLVPRGLNRRFYELLRRCLDKNPKRRWRHCGDLAVEIETVLSQPHEVAVRARSSSRVPWAVAALALIAGVVVAWALWPAPANRAVIRLSVDLGVNAELFTSLGSALSLSPDGKLLAFVASSENEPRRMYLRRLDELRASVLPGTEDARNAFFSPDGQWIAFFADGRLKKVSVKGGPPVTICDAPNARGGSWGDDGYIVFAPDPVSGLVRVSSSGGTPQPLTKLVSGEVSHRWPQLIQGGRAVLYTASPSAGDYSNASSIVESIPGGDRRVIHQGGSYARYLSSGHLVYLQGSTVYAAPFDIQQMKLTGEPAAILDAIQAAPLINGGMNFAFSTSGSIAYVAGTAYGGYSLEWMGQDRTRQPLRSMPALYRDIRVSPHGTRLAMSLADAPFDIWVYDWTKETTSRLTTHPAQDFSPLWTPDGQRITFASNREEASNIYWQSADGTGKPERLTESKNNQRPNSWHPSGKFLVFQESTGAQGNWDMMLLPMNGDEKSGWKAGTPTVFLGSPANEINAAFSPDGNSIAYQSNESGTNEIYVTSFPAHERKSLISSAGGDHPVWSPKAKELFYRAPDRRIMVVSYSTAGGSFQAEKPRVWSEGTVPNSGLGLENNSIPFDIDADGKRFAFIKPDSPSATRFDKVVLVLNFFDELRRMTAASSK
jgi:serine/threonine-protein kinase